MPLFHLRNLRNLRFHRLFFRRLLVICLSLLAAIALLNLLVDPFGIYRVISWGDAVKFKSALGTRIAKAEAVRQRGWDVVILGGSAAETALAPTIPAWDGRRVYNCGLSATNMSELLQATHLALQNPDLKEIILCVDMEDFYSGSVLPNDYGRSLLNPQINLFEYHLAALLGMNATDQSLRSLHGLFRRRLGDHTPQGLLLSGNPRSATRTMAIVRCGLA